MCAARGVHNLSTMARAVGGPQGFASSSPSVIIRAAASGETPQNPQPSEIISETALHKTNLQEKKVQISPTLNLSSKISTEELSTGHLHGEAISARIGLDRASLGSVENISSSSLTSTVTTAAVPAVEFEPFLKLSRPQVCRFPPTILQSSTSDTIVPWYESADMHWALHDCGVPSKCLTYARVGHGDFVVNWQPLPSPIDVHTVDDLPPYAADFVNILRGDADLRYLRRPLDGKSKIGRS